MHYPYYMYFSSVSLLSRNTKFSSSPCTRSLHTSGKDTVLPNRRAIKDVSIVAPVLSDRTATNMHMAGVCLDRRGRRISVTGKDALSSSTRFDNKWDPYRFLGLTCPFMVNSARVLTCTIRGRTKKWNDRFPGAKYIHSPCLNVLLVNTKVTNQAANSFAKCLSYDVALSSQTSLQASGGHEEDKQSTRVMRSY